MKFFIPEIADRFRLTTDFVANIQNEYRNHRVILANPKRAKQHNDAWEVHKMDYYEREKMTFEVPLKAGTVLSVARVYIRKGASDYSSLTFNILESPQPEFELKKKGGTWKSGPRSFWLPLDQVHQMEFEPA